MTNQSLRNDRREEQLNGQTIRQNTSFNRSLKEQYEKRLEKEPARGDAKLPAEPRPVSGELRINFPSSRTRTLFEQKFQQSAAKKIFSAQEPWSSSQQHKSGL